jgi:hypothetical protein
MWFEQDWRGVEGVLQIDRFWGGWVCLRVEKENSAFSRTSLQS